MAPRKNQDKNASQLALLFFGDFVQKQELHSNAQIMGYALRADRRHLFDRFFEDVVTTASAARSISRRPTT